MKYKWTERYQKTMFLVDMVIGVIAIVLVIWLLSKGV